MRRPPDPTGRVQPRVRPGPRGFPIFAHLRPFRSFRPPSCGLRGTAVLCSARGLCSAAAQNRIISRPGLAVALQHAVFRSGHKEYCWLAKQGACVRACGKPAWLVVVRACAGASQPGWVGGVEVTAVTGGLRRIERSDVRATAWPRQKARRQNGQVALRAPWLAAAAAASHPTAT